MKIAIVSDAIYPYNKGGKEKRIYEISTNLAKKGHKVHIYCMKWWKTRGNHRVENGVHLHAISKYYPLYAGPRRSIKQAIFFGLACLKLIKEDFDVIDVDHMPFFPLFTTKLICLIKEKKMITTWNEVWGWEYWMKYMGWLGIFGYLLERLSITLPDKIIAISELTKQKLIFEMNCNKEIIIVTGGVDVDKIYRIKRAAIKSDIIFAGRLLKHKNVDLLIRAVKLLTIDLSRRQAGNQQLKCLIIGDGPERVNLEKLVKDLKLENNVFFLGFLPNHNDVYALMKSSKVFVNPSEREGFGLAVLEANTCGIPVITLDHENNAAKELVQENNNGFLTKYDEKELAEKILKILSPKKQYVVLQKRIKNFLKDIQKSHHWKFVTQRISEAYTL